MCPRHIFYNLKRVNQHRLAFSLADRRPGLLMLMLFIDAVLMGIWRLPTLEVAFRCSFLFVGGCNRVVKTLRENVRGAPR